MDTRGVAIIAGVAGGIGWVGKLVVLAAQGGPDPDSVLESVAFVLGLAGVVVCAAATAAFLTLSRSVAVRTGIAVAAVVALVVVIGLAQLALASLPGDSWVQEEAVFAVTGAAALLVAGWLARGGPAADAPV